MRSPVERAGVSSIAIVGDAFAKPMLRALDASPDKYDISSLVMISSSGVMFSEESKQGLLRHHPGMMIVDAFSSSEALGMGQSVSTAEIGRALCRERVCQSVWISVVPVSLKKQQQ